MLSTNKVRAGENVADGEDSRVRYEWLLLVLVFLACCAVIVARRPDALFNPQFYVEDGNRFYADAHEIGPLRALFATHRGYFCIAQRLGAALAMAVPFAFAPLVTNLVGIVLQSMPAVFLASSRLVPARPLALRLGMALLYVAMPATWATNANLTHSMWHLAPLACMIVVAQPARTLGWRCFDGGMLLLAGLTGPYSVFLAPVAALKWYVTRHRRDLVVAAAVAVMGTIQATSLLLTPAPAEGRIPVGPSVYGFAQIVAQRVVYGALLGQRGVEKIIGNPANPLDSEVCISLAAALGIAAFGYAALRGPLELRLAVLFAWLTFAAALVLPAPSAPAIWWDLLKHPGNGNRYFVTMVFTLLSTLVWFASQRRVALRAAGVAGLAIAVLFGVRYDRREPPYPDYKFAEAAWRYRNAADNERVIVQTPPDWELALTKRGGRDPDDVRECPREVQVDTTLLLAHEVELRDGVANATGGDPYLIYGIPSHGRVCGVRITYKLRTPQNQNAALQLFWAREGVNTFVAGERNSMVRVRPTGVPQTTTFHVDDRIDRIRIDPHTAGTQFQLLDVVLLLEPEAT